MSVVGIITDIISVIQAIKEVCDKVEGNKATSSLMCSRLDRIVPSLYTLSKDQKTTFKGGNLANNLHELKVFIDEVLLFFKKFADKSYFLKAFDRNTDASTFEEYNQRLSHFVESLQLGISVDVQVLRRENEAAFQKDFESMKTMIVTMMKARDTDAATLAAMTASMERNYLVSIEITKRLSLESSSGHKSFLDTKFGVMEVHLQQMKLEIKNQIRDLLQPNNPITFTDGGLGEGGQAVTKSAVSEGEQRGDQHRYKDLKVINQKDLVKETEKIGRGSFGSVFKGTLRNSKVAIKTVNAEVRRSKSAEKVLDEVKREAMIMQLLDSPFVVRFFGVQLDPEYPLAIVMELASCTLDDVLHMSDPGKLLYRNAIGNEPLSLASKVSVIYTICDALDYMHGFDILHRDVKPLNVLIVDGKPKLSDFGLSKDLTIGGGNNNSSIGNGPKGTYSYLAPELFDAKSCAYSKASDVYAFGVTVNEIIAERRPFHNKAVIEIMTTMAITKGEIRFADLFLASSRNKIDDDHVFEFSHAGRGSVAAVNNLMPVGDGILTDLESIIVDCWSASKSARPSFAVLLKRIERVRFHIEVALDMERNKSNAAAIVAKESKTVDDGGGNANVTNTSNRPLEELTVDDVQSLLGGLSLGEYKPEFRRGNIDGEMLSCCDSADDVKDLVNSSIIKPVHAKILLKRIELYKKEGVPFEILTITSNIAGSDTNQSKQPAPYTSSPAEGRRDSTFHSSTLSSTSLSSTTTTAPSLFPSLSNVSDATPPPPSIPAVVSTSKAPPYASHNIASAKPPIDSVDPATLTDSIASQQMHINSSQSITTSTPSASAVRPDVENQKLVLISASQKVVGSPLSASSSFSFTPLPFSFSTKEAKFDNIFRLILVGDERVGRTQLMNRFAEDSFSDVWGPYSSGIDFKIRTVKHEERVIKLQIFETPGKEIARSIATSCFRGAHGLIVIYDITDADSFADAKRWFEAIDRHADKEVNRLLVGNKSDLSFKRVVTFEQGKDLADSLGVKFLEVSAKDGSGVEKAFYVLTSQIKSRIERDEVYKNSKLNAKIVKDPKARNGCLLS